MTEEVKTVNASEQKKEDWMNNKWRPMMGWMYMSVCIFDFMIAPIMWSLVQALFHGGVNLQWQPLTLQGAGLFHISMGAVLGLAAYGRTQEKLAGANNGGLSSAGTTYTVPAAIQPTAPAAFGSTMPGTSVTPAPSWGTTPTAPSSVGGGSGFGTPANAEIVTGFGGKPAPVIPPFPER